MTEKSINVIKTCKRRWPDRGVLDVSTDEVDYYAKVEGDPREHRLDGNFAFTCVHIDCLRWQFDDYCQRLDALESKRDA